MSRFAEVSRLQLPLWVSIFLLETRSKCVVAVLDGQLTVCEKQRLTSKMMRCSYCEVGGNSTFPMRFCLTAISDWSFESPVVDTFAMSRSFSRGMLSNGIYLEIVETNLRDHIHHIGVVLSGVDSSGIDAL